MKDEVEIALDNARWLLSKESEQVDEAQVAEVGRALAEQVRGLARKLVLPEYTTKGYRRLRVERRYEHGDDRLIDKGIEHLREALTMFLGGGAPKTAARVRFALSSALGARRHVANRKLRRIP